MYYVEFSAAVNLMAIYREPISCSTTLGLSPNLPTSNRPAVGTFQDGENTIKRPLSFPHLRNIIGYRVTDNNLSV